VNFDSALLSLASHALSAAQTEADELSVFQSLAEVTKDMRGQVAQTLHSHAQSTARALLVAHEMRAGLRDYVQGQLPLAKGSSDGHQ